MVLLAATIQKQKWSLLLQARLQDWENKLSREKMKRVYLTAKDILNRNACRF